MSLNRRARSLAGRALRRARAIVPSSGPGAPASSAPVPRHDPVPPMAPFPRGRYVFLVEAVPRNFGGRTTSILRKAGLFHELAGVESELCIQKWSGELFDAVETWRERGLVPEGLRITSLDDYIDDPTAYQGDPVEHPLEIPGMVRVYSERQGGHRYFEDGVYRLYRRYNAEGRLLLQDTWNEYRVRLKREHFTEHGTVRRRVFMDPHYNRPRQELYYRRDGSVLVNIMYKVGEDGRTTTVDRVTWFDLAGQVAEVRTTDHQLWERSLDALVGDPGGRPVFLTVEARDLDNPTLAYQRPDVRTVHALHSTHLKPPYTDTTAVRPMCEPIMSRPQQADAVVFLTDAQRADAEDVTGVQAHFSVIPHPAPATDTRDIERDPDLVVIVSRLHEQKGVVSAIKAFVRAAPSIPDARLDIYGQGPQIGDLRRLINSSGLRDRITLMDYTDDVPGVYRRAALSLMTSKAEGFGLAVMESLAQGCPVISFDLKYGPRDLIVDGRNGYLVGGRSVAGMAQRIVEVMGDAGTRERLWRGAQGSVDDMSVEAYAARWSKVFADADRRAISRAVRPASD